MQQFEGAGGVAVGSCPNCIHYRFSDPPNPLAGVRLTSAKALEVRAKWQKELTERALLEQERRDAGDAFDFEPVAYAHCLHFSREESGGDRLNTWVLCDIANPNDECSVFVARDK